MSRRASRRLAVASLALAALLGAAATARAQAFGRNKVQYEDFAFETVRTEHFRIYRYPREDAVARDAAAMLERWHDRLAGVLDASVGEDQPIVLYANHPDFQQTNVVFGLVPQGVRGVTEGLKRRIALPLSGIPAANDHVLGHELVHAFQYAILREHGLGPASSGRLPLWFVEGMAEYLTRGPAYGPTAMWMRDAVAHDDVPTITEIGRDARYFPYRYGHAVWAYLTSVGGDAAVGRLLRGVAEAGWRPAFRQTFGASLDTLSSSWQDAIRDTHGSQLQGRDMPAEAGEPLVTGEGGLNLSPALSPDGRRLAYLSRRDLFTIDLYLADATTGEVLRKLASSASDQHFDALSFMQTSGCWSPDGARFAFVVMREGDSEIAIADVAGGDVRRTLAVPDVAEITQIDWSPDGDRLVLSGIARGRSDLYVYDLGSDSLTALTDDVHADLQPTWSPDGETIAFVTDRGEGTDLQQQIHGPLRIGLLDAAQGSIELFGLPGATKHVSPQFTPAGDALLFVADPDGYSDVYRRDLRHGATHRVTRLATGVSGLSAYSPALSVARDDGRVVACLFEKTHYNLYRLPDALTADEPFAPAPERPGAQLALAPSRRAEQVSRYLRSPAPAPALASWDPRAYDPDLDLIHVGQAAAGVAVDRFGARIGGGASLLYSDDLGHRLLNVAVQASGTIEDIGGQAVYQNRDDRINWGAGLSHIPYRSGYARSRVREGTVGGEETLVQEVELVRQRIFVDRAEALFEYPFSRFRRAELALGYTHVGFDYERDVVTATLDGRVLDEQSGDLDAPSSLNLAHASLAYVGDYSFFGFTSPVRGRRYRVAVEPTAGSLDYVSLLADYRHYQFWRPLTLAWRVSHLGRYLGDSESDRLAPYYLGFETWVRGYAIGSVDLSECDGDDDCVTVNRLEGSRVALASLELRLPVLGTDEFGLASTSFLPTQAVAFLDGGVAWTRHESPTWTLAARSSERTPVFSAGGAVRLNLFGALVMQVYWAYPFQRPDAGGQFGFVLAPGW